MPKPRIDNDKVRLVMRMADRLHRLGPVRRAAYIEKARLSGANLSAGALRLPPARHRGSCANARKIVFHR